LEAKAQARGYRDRAEELRRIAANYRHEGARKDLLALAEQWDAMAERLETQMPLSEILSQLKKANPNLKP